MARPAVGLVVSMSFITEATVTIGWRGSSSKSRKPPMRHPVVREDARAIVGDEREQLACGCDGLVGDRGDAVEEEVEPALPVALDAHGVEPTVVLFAMPLEEEAQVEERLGQQLPVLEQQRHEQAPDPAVAVEVRVDGLELHVQQPRAHERGQLSSPWRYFSKAPSSSPSACGGGGTYARVAGAAAADPVLAASHLAGQLLGARARRA